MCLFFKTEPQLNITNRSWSVINSVLKISSTPCHQEAWKSIQIQLNRGNQVTYTDLEHQSRNYNDGTSPENGWTW